MAVRVAKTRLRLVLSSVQVIAVLAMTCTAMWCGPTTAAAAESEESALLALTNQARASVGAAALSPDPALSRVARWWVGNMAGERAISHNPDLASEIANWSRLAENVGSGSSISLVHHALLASPDHYANLTNPDYSLVGIGVESVGGRLYVVEDFGAPAGGRTIRPAQTEPPPQVTQVAPATTTPAPDPPAPPFAAPPGPSAPAGPPAVSPTPPPTPSAASTISFVLDALSALDPGQPPSLRVGP